MVGICMEISNENYGTMLQALATIRLIEKRGYQSRILVYQKKWSPVSLLRQLPRVLNRTLLHTKLEALSKKAGLLWNRSFRNNNGTRSRAFSKFRDRQFRTRSVVYRGYGALGEGARQYAVIVSGSDQLWSPAGLATNFYNLRFVPEGIRKVSYASSFGVTQIPWYQKSRTTAYLMRMDMISLREESGKKIVTACTGREAPVVPDPVLMLNETEWAELAPIEIDSKEPYIFAYFLGGNQAHRRAVNDLAALTDMKIVTLRHLDRYTRGDEKFGTFAPYDVDPVRFLNLLRNAAYVCTDSFHGTCFSVICKKKFLVFNRYPVASKQSKNSRIDTLCHRLGLENRRYNGGNIAGILQDIDYDTVHQKLRAMQEEANRYLDRALADANAR